jgi:eukaryotic-like serine/threonine-protein kinase
MASSAVFGKYRLLAELGHGGMADVFLAVQAGPVGSGFSKLTVIKRLRRNLADEPEFVSMLVDEARIAARLNHPNVVQTNEVGEVDQHYFIAMEYLDGQPFHRLQNRAVQRVKNGLGPLLTKDHQYAVLMDALAGLHHAHELVDYDGTKLEIVHRDVTPHNIFVTYEGQVKVVDFGVAKAVGRASETRQGVIKGKVRYMAPEQALGRDVDRRADVFAAGVILWEIAVGRRMWKDKDDVQIVQAIAAGDFPPGPREVDPNVPEAIDRICRNAIRLNPEERYATAEEFRADLEQHLADTGQLVDARRRLPRVVNELFADKRAEIKSIIENQLSLLSAKHSSQLRPVMMGPESMPGSGSSSASSDVVSQALTALEPTALSPAVMAQGPDSIASAANVASGPTFTGVAGEPPPKPRRQAAFVIGALALAAIGALAIGRATSSHSNGTSADTHSSETPVASNAEPSPSAAEATSAEASPTNVATPSPTEVESAAVKATGVVAPSPMGKPLVARVATPPPPRPGRTGPVDPPAPAPTHDTSPKLAATAATTQVPAPSPPAPTPSPAPAPSPAAAPAAIPTTASTSPPGFVDPKGVRATVRSHASEAQACYDRAQMEKPDLKGTIAIAATVNPTGDVISANITNATVHHPRLESCLLGAFRSWRFPAPAGGVNGSVSYNFKFD